MNGPHSRACGGRPHEHGTACHANCPTCGGGTTPPCGLVGCVETYPHGHGTDSSGVQWTLPPGKRVPLAKKGSLDYLLERAYLAGRDGGAFQSFEQWRRGLLP